MSQPTTVAVQSAGPGSFQREAMVNHVWKNLEFSNSVSDKRSKPMSSRIFSYSKRVPDKGNSTAA